MKTAIVTGAGHGIGKAVTQKLLSENCKVFALDISKNYLEALKQEKCERETLTCILCDVGNPKDIRAAIETAQRENTKLDYIVNNAGIGHFKPLEEMSIDEWQRVLSVNLSSIFYMTKFAKTLLNERSSIVNIASTRAFMSERDTEAYSASKGGIVALTHALAVSLSPKTRVNCISPGWISVKESERLSAEDHTQHLVGRVGIPDDIAELAWFLLNSKSSFITGQNFTADGGMTKKMIYI